MGMEWQLEDVLEGGLAMSWVTAPIWRGQTSVQPPGAAKVRGGEVRGGGGAGHAQQGMRFEYGERNRVSSAVSLRWCVWLVCSGGVLLRSCRDVVASC